MVEMKDNVKFYHLVKTSNLEAILSSASAANPSATKTKNQN
jgi:hypothetical protein